MAVLAVLGIALGSAVLAGPSPAPPRSADALASPSGSAAASAGATGEPAADIPLATPLALAPRSPYQRTAIILRGQADPAGALGALTGCPQLQRALGAPPPAIKGEDVDAAAARAGRDTGWLFVPPGLQAATKVWLGDDLVTLAQAVGQWAAAVGTDGSVWLGGASGATRWQPLTTPVGRTAWVMTRDEVTGAGECGPWPVPDAIDGLRSVTCAGISELACVTDADHVTPILRRAGTDVVVVGTGACKPGCDGDPRVVVSLAGASDEPTKPVDIAMAGPLAAWLVTDPAYVLPSRALDAIGRASMPLPRAAAAGRPCGRKIVEGTLVGRPWDARVAWLNGTAVRWPAGTFARFTPQLTLFNADGDVIARAGDIVDVVETASTAAAFEACMVNLRTTFWAP